MFKFLSLKRRYGEYYSFRFDVKKTGITFRCKPCYDLNGIIFIKNKLRRLYFLVSESFGRNVLSNTCVI